MKQTAVPARQPRVMAERCCPCPPPCSSDGAALARVPGAMNVPLKSPLRRSLSSRCARMR
jgi:hypothetical protein